MDDRDEGQSQHPDPSSRYRVSHRVTARVNVLPLGSRKTPRTIRRNDDGSGCGITMVDLPSTKQMSDNLSASGLHGRYDASLACVSSPGC